jgi:hypothetical protein
MPQRSTPRGTAALATRAAQRRERQEQTCCQEEENELLPKARRLDIDFMALGQAVARPQG